MARVVIAEDDPKQAELIRRYAVAEGHDVVVRAGGRAALDEVRERVPDLLILDVMMPGLDGFGVLRALRAVKQTPVIMLTARDSIEDRVRGLGEGADDYLIKPFSFLELLARLQALTRRSRVQDAMQLAVGDLRIDLVARRATRAGQRIDLTAKEFALLTALAKREGEILSKTAIAELVWDMNFDSNTNVVEVAIKRLRAKVDAPFGTRLLHTIRGMGYVLEVRADDASAGGADADA